MAAAAARKTVTVLFCDLAGSTALGESLDPESLRALLARWYDAMRLSLERHGGTVEKFIGDAVMAVFGVPQAHEDDALRAVRAALEMRRRVALLNEELAAESRPPLRIRIGINTGEVATGDAATTLVTGDAVNVAKRLEEAAPPGEILVGSTTRVLVENAAELERLPGIAAKGKRRPLESWRVLGAIEGAAPIARRLDAPLVGRTRELERLREELAAAEHERTCRLVTVFGAAGVGKSRLAAELLDAVRDRAGVLSARCVPYGDGLSFLPVEELVRSAGGENAIMRAVGDEPDGALIVERICGDAPLPAEETFWAVRRALETLARRRPLVVFVEDLHWAEPTFLDLLEYVAAWSRDAPILLLALARPELLDARPRWGGASLTLEPLADGEAAELLRSLAAEWPVPADAEPAILEAAEGNPLFVEQLVAMLAETGSVRMPPTIQALLAARLDGLEPGEREVLDRAAVVGREFTRGAVSHLLETSGASLQGTLLALVRKELVRPARSTLAGDDGFAFRHALIRDAAYEALPKALRGDLHERFAAWLERHAEEDELVGYHLEQAHRCRADVGPSDAALAERGARLLAAAGRRAFARDDMPAAANLFERSLALFEFDGERPALLRELGVARWRSGDIPGAADATEAAIERAASARDVREEWYARLDRSARRAMQEGSRSDLAEVAGEALRVFAELGDEVGLARALRRLAIVSLHEWRFAEAAEQAERGLEHARRGGETGDRVGLADVLCSALLCGAEPAPAAAARCRLLLEALEQVPPVRATVASTLAVLEAMQEAFAEARALAAEAATVYDRLGVRLPRAGLAELAAQIELLAGDLPAAERELRLAYETMREAGSARLAALEAANLASVTARQGRAADAAAWLELARPHADPDDRDSRVTFLLAEARVAAAQGRPEEALDAAEAAVALVDETEWLSLRAETLAVRAGIAGEEPVEALDLYARKGNLAAAARLRELVATHAPR